MFIRIESSDDPQDNTEQKSSFTTVLFQYVRTLLCFGGIYCGEGNATRRWKKKVALLIFFLYIVHIPLYAMAIYDSSRVSRHTLRLVGFQVICAANVYLSFVSLVKMPKDLAELEQVFNMYKEKYKSTFVSFNRLRLLKIMTPFMLLNCVVFGPFQMFLYRHNEDILCDVYPSCHLPDYWKYFGFALNAVFSLMSHIQWQGHFLVCVIFAIFLMKEFQKIAEKFKELSMSSASNVERECEVLVEHHECLVDVLNTTNDCIRHYSFSILFLCIPVNCSLLYAAISKTLSEPELIFLSFTITTSLSILFIKVVLEGLVSSKAHDPLRYIWKVRRRLVSEAGRETLDLFVTRLTGDTIGFNVYGLLTISLPTLLGIIGTLTTYVIVVVQFKPTDAPLCNQSVVGNVTVGGASILP
ncbi:uncharacterized protein [Haliotis asinina]|uniref:uncharacterized protein n=1 Tax=Haliotis asinina TaxID=109174 RepID=UPI0035318938